MAQNETTRKRFFDDTLNTVTLKQLNEYRKSEEYKFCDWILKSSDGEEFHVHKNILASTCPYFTALFNTNLVENRSESMILSNITGSNLSRILDYIYSGEIEIDIENMNETFETASYLRLKNLQNFTANHMKNNVNDITCVDIWRFSDKNLCEKLSDYCVKYITEKAEKWNISFLENLTANEILTLLKTKTINCSEDKICELVISWISNDYENRKKFANEMFDEIRLPLLSEEFLASNVLGTEFLDKCEVFSKKIFGALKMKFLLNGNQPIFHKSAQPRYGNRSKKIFIIDGNSYYVYSKEEGVLRKKSNLPLSFSYEAAHTIFNDNYWFICGLGDSRSQCICYCPIKDKWSNFYSMTTARKNHGVVFIRDKIYVCGGDDIAGTEYFDISQEKWFVGISFSGKRSRFGICAVDDCIYTVGGLVNLIERLDLREGKWTEIGRTRAQYSTACIIKNSLYCMGSNDGQIFDLRKNQWEDLMIPIFSFSSSSYSSPSSSSSFSTSFSPSNPLHSVSLFGSNQSGMKSFSSTSTISMPVKRNALSSNQCSAMSNWPIFSSSIEPQPNITFSDQHKKPVIIDSCVENDGIVICGRHSSSNGYNYSIICRYGCENKMWDYLYNERTDMKFSAIASLYA